MDCSNSSNCFTYVNIEQVSATSNASNSKKNNKDKHLQKNLRITNMSDADIDKSVRHKACKEYTNDNTRTVTNIIGTAIPIISSLACGITAKGNTADKTRAALIAGKQWGLFIAGAYLLNKAVIQIIKNVNPIKDFTDNHPGLTIAGIIIGCFEAGKAAIHYGDKALTKLLDNKSIDERLTKFLQKSSMLKNKTLEKTINKLENFANSPKGEYAGIAAITGLGVLIVKNFYDLFKVDYKISKTKENLKEKRFNASKELANDLWKKRNTPKNTSTAAQGIIVFSNKEEF